MRAYRLIIPVLVLLVSCKSASVVTNTNDIYEEDLSYLRPDLAPPFEQVVSGPLDETLVKVEFVDTLKPKLDSLNEIIIERNKGNSYVDGYVIQIYNGNDREAAAEAQNLMLELDPSLNPVTAYYQPTYKVKVGQYTNRLEAHKVYESLKPHFPRATMIPERIKVKYE
jgi:predicted Zn-dependent protease